MFTLSHSAVLKWRPRSISWSGPLWSGSNLRNWCKTITAFFLTSSFGWPSKSVTVGSKAFIKSAPISLQAAVKAVHTARKMITQYLYFHRSAQIWMRRRRRRRRRRRIRRRRRTRKRRRRRRRRRRRIYLKLQFSVNGIGRRHKAVEWCDMKTLFLPYSTNSIITVQFPCSYLCWQYYSVSK